MHASVTIRAALLLFIASCAVLSAQEPLHKVERRNLLEHVPDRGLVVKTVNGSIEVIQGESEVVLVEATFRGRNPDRLRDARLHAARDDDGTLRLGVTWPAREEDAKGKRSGNEGCSFRVVVPDVSSVALRSANGRLTLKGLMGSADLKTSNGRITVKDHEGSVSVRTSNGRVEARGIDGKLDVKTSNGRIVAEDVTGDCDLRTSNGKVAAARIDAALQVKTSNGSVRVALSDGCRGPVDLASSNGSVTLAVGSAFAGKLLASTSRPGKIAIEGAPAARPRSVTAGGLKQEIDFGGQGSRSRVRTSHGKIKITGLAERPLQ